MSIENGQKQSYNKITVYEAPLYYISSLYWKDSYNTERIDEIQLFYD